MKNILFEPANQLIKNIKNKTYSVEQVVQAHLEQIEQYNPTINAVTDMYSKEAILQEAKQKDLMLQQGQDLGPLYGLPMTIKDSYQVKGLITSNGVPYLKNNRVPKDAALVQRLRKAGAVIMGKTNLPLFAIDWQSTNKWFGQTNNPYDLNRVVGGSSGGSSAALASGFTALEMGSDAGGSIRVPAHFCGVCGLRPTEGALTGRGHLEAPGQVRSIRYITSCGPLARNTDDLLLAMEVLWDKKSSYAEIAPVDFYRSSWDNQQPLKIAYSNTLGDIELDSQYKVVYDQFINKLKQSTHLLKEDKPSYNSDECIDLWGSVVGFDFGANMPNLVPFKKFLARLFIYSKSLVL
ncbi:MAG: amidase, partial [Aureispira sp.]|nr:amidase [Aureispira sp.]